MAANVDLIVGGTIVGEVKPYLFDVNTVFAQSSIMGLFTHKLGRVKKDDIETCAACTDESSSSRRHCSLA